MLGVRWLVRGLTRPYSFKTQRLNRLWPDSHYSPMQTNSLVFLFSTPHMSPRFVFSLFLIMITYFPVLFAALIIIFQDTTIYDRSDVFLLCFNYVLLWWWSRSAQKNREELKPNFCHKQLSRPKKELNTDVLHICPSMEFYAREEALGKKSSP